MSNSEFASEQESEDTKEKLKTDKGPTAYENYSIVALVIAIAAVIAVSVLLPKVLSGLHYDGRRKLSATTFFHFPVISSGSLTDDEDSSDRSSFCMNEGIAVNKTACNCKIEFSFGSCEGKTVSCQVNRKDKQRIFCSCPNKIRGGLCLKSPVACKEGKRTKNFNICQCNTGYKGGTCFENKVTRDALCWRKSGQYRCMCNAKASGTLCSKKFNPGTTIEGDTNEFITTEKEEPTKVNNLSMQLGECRKSMPKSPPEPLLYRCQSFNTPPTPESDIRILAKLGESVDEFYFYITYKCQTVERLLELVIKINDNSLAVQQKTETGATKNSKSVNLKKNIQREENFLITLRLLANSSTVSLNEEVVLEHDIPDVTDRMMFWYMEGAVATCVDVVNFS